MASKDAIQKLSTLTEQQLDILRLRCEAWEILPIAHKLNWSEATVKQEIGRNYAKLGLDKLTRVQRYKALFGVYCPLLKDADFQPSTEPDLPEPVPDKIGKMIDEDEKAFASLERMLQEASAEPPQRSYPKRYLLLLVGAIFGMCLAVVSTACLLYVFREPLGIGAKPQATQALASEKVTVEVTSVLAPAQPTSASETEVVPTVADTAAPKDTETPVPSSPTPEPTHTPVPPTPTPIPTDTPIPTRTIPPNTSPGSVLEVGEGWKQDDVEFKLKEITLGASSECLALRFDLYNDTDHSIVVTMELDDFTVEDNLGRRWSGIGMFEGYVCYQLPATSENKIKSRTVDPGDDFGALWISFAGYVTDTDVDEVIVTVNLSHINNARWRVPIYN